MYVSSHLFELVLATASSSLTGCLGESNFKGGVPILDHDGSKEFSLPRASNIAFTSLPTLRLNEQSAETGSLPVQLTFSPGVGGQVYSGSCPDYIAYGDQSITSYPQRKYFSSHWPAEAVHKALEVSLITCLKSCILKDMLIKRMCGC